MRKNLLLCLILLLVTLPAQAQDPTIVDILADQSQATPPEFVQLGAAIAVANPVVAELFNDPDAAFTVFAPNDAAFTRLQQELGIAAVGNLLADQAGITTVLQYHTIDGIVNELNDGDELTALNGETLTVAVDDETTTINGAAIVGDPIEAANGIIYVIDQVLLPASPEDSAEGAAQVDEPEATEEPEAESTEEPTDEPTDEPAAEDVTEEPQAEESAVDTTSQTIAEIVIASASAEEPEFATLLAAVQAADPSVLAALSDAESDLTVFAPTDAAFAAVDGLDAILEDQELLTNILLYHVAGESSTAEEILFGFEALDTDTLIGTMLLAGDPLVLTLNADGQVVLDGVALVIQTDIVASNGIIHVIDAVLVPDGE